MVKRLLLILSLAFFLSGCNRLDQHQPLTTEVSRVKPGDTIEETFLARRDYLNIVSICIRNPDRILLPVTFELWEKGQAAPLRTIDFSSGNIDNVDCTRLQFEPIPNSAQTTYTARLKVGATTALTNAPQFLTIEKDAGHLHYKTFYRQDIEEVIHESLTQLPPRLLADWGFLIVWVGLVGSLIWRLLGQKQS